MKHLALALIWVLILISDSYAQQKQGAWWYFGNKAGVNFNTEPPSPDSSGQSAAVWGCASVSDANGNLLFYSDGRNVYNKLHQVMPNGANIILPGSSRSSANVMIVQKPGSTFLYYLFVATGFNNALTPNFSFSIIDLRLDGGKGDIILNTKNSIVFSNSIASKFTAAMHANNRDVWVVAHSRTGNNYYSFLVSPSGIAAPVTTPLGILFAASNEFGVMKCSPNSELIADAISSGSSGGPLRERWTQLLDLNRSSGVLSNLRTFTFTGLLYPYGIAFSPDNSKLYLSDVMNVYQYNLQAGSFPNVLASRVTLQTDTTIWHWDMQLGLNGKIYLTSEANFYNQYSSNLDKYLGIINCPDALGNACGYQDTAIYLGRIGGRNLPALNQTLFRNANILQLTAPESYTCVGKPIKLSAFGAGADNFTWLPANGLMPINSPEIMVNPSVTTTYTVIGYSQCDSDTASITINVVPPAFANAGPDKVICQTGSIQLGVPTQPGLTYAWNSSSFLSDTTSSNPTFTATNNTTSDQVYQLVLTIDGPGVSCGKRTDTVQVTVKPQLTVNAGTPVSFCSGTSVQLNPQQFNNNYSYSWSPVTGLSNANTFAPTLNLSNFSSQPDTVFYTLTATDQGCSVSGQVRMVVLPEPKPVLRGPASVCPGSAQIAYVVQNPQAGTTYSWGISGGTISQTFTDSIWVNWGATSATAKIWVIGQNSFSCQSDTVFFSVIINPLLATEKPKGNDTICNNDRLNQFYQIARAQGSVYNWGITGGSILSGQGSNQIRVNWNGTGQHKLWVQESAQTSLAQCFGVSDTLQISVIPSPDTTLTVQGPASACHQTSQTYSLAGNNASTYIWQVTGGSITSGQGSNSITVEWQTVGSGEVKVLETLPNSCAGNWITLNVQVNPIPVTTLSPNVFFCHNALTQTYQVQGLPGSSFQWVVNGGSLLSMQGNSQATILWDSLASNPSYEVIETSVSGCSSGGQKQAVTFDRSEVKLLSVGLDEAEASLAVKFQLKNGQHYPQNYLNIEFKDIRNPYWQTLGPSLILNQEFTVSPEEFEKRTYRLQGWTACGTALYSGFHKAVKLTATANEQTQEVVLTWNSYKGWQDTIQYEIWQKPSEQEPYRKITSSTDSVLTLKTGRDGFQQRYRIKAIAKAGYQSWSNSAGVSFENALDLPNIITPNNDGRNETFTAQSLLLYPNLSLKIYNRWGKEVYSNLNYKGDWNASGLSNGTYFYLLQTKDGKSFKGWVEVAR